MAGEWQPTHRHYKGGLYRVLGCAQHTETGDLLVIYDNALGLWARPRDMFDDTLPDGQKRFERIVRAAPSSPEGEDSGEDDRI